jgi:phosphoglycerate kinase
MSTYRFQKKTLRDIDVDGKRVLLRADFNVPLDEDGTIDSNFRIVKSLPTIEYLVKHKADVVILAHLGRPDGKKVAHLSLKPIAKELEKLLGSEVGFVAECMGDQVKQALKKIVPHRVTVLENVRFHAQEEDNDPDFARAIVESTTPDFVVQDGFGVVHRAHTSTEGISHIVPAVAGLLLETEVSELTKAIKHPARPLVAVLGGAKISDKLPLVEEFLKTADTILIGGAMANNFIKHAGHKIGKSVYEPDQEAEVTRIVKQAKKDQLFIPVDVATAKAVDEDVQRHDCGLDDVKTDDYILDIGFETMRLFHEHLRKAGTVIWNGTLGFAENPQFSQSSAVIADSLSSQYPGLTSIIGGGDTADYVLEWQQKHPGKHFTHISTGGGASLELLSGEKLPGVEALLNR